ncbi:MAG: hypothetical protein ACNA7G_10660 [Methylobacter sp.]
MNTPIFKQKTMQWLTLLMGINFNIAVVFLLIASVVSATGSSAIFDNNAELYGPLASNLRLMLVYLTISQFSVYCFCSYSQNYRPLMAVGVFWLTLMGAIDFYGMVNQIVIDVNYDWLFLYLGVSNLLYGGLSAMQRHYLRQDTNRQR